MTFHNITCFQLYVSLYHLLVIQQTLRDTIRSNKRLLYICIWHVRTHFINADPAYVMRLGLSVSYFYDIVLTCIPINLTNEQIVTKVIEESVFFLKRISKYQRISKCFLSSLLLSPQRIEKGKVWHSLIAGSE